MTARREFSKKVKAEAFVRAKGRCEKCNVKLMGNAEYDHIVPTAYGQYGPPTLANCQLLCQKCHRQKTSTRDVPAIAKADRIKRKLQGRTKKHKAIIPGSKASGWKKKLNGPTEKRT